MKGISRDCQFQAGIRIYLNETPHSIAACCHWLRNWDSLQQHNFYTKLRENWSIHWFKSTHTDSMLISEKEKRPISKQNKLLTTDPEVRVRFPALPDFLRSSGSGTGSTQHEYKWEDAWKKKSNSGLENRVTAVGNPPRWLRDIHLSAKVGTNVADKRLTLGRYSSLAD
jgi:hypothetical protein